VHGFLYLLSFVYCQVAVSASGRSLVQRNRTGCGVSERDREASKIRRLRPTEGYCAMEKKVHSTIRFLVMFFN
jgi:hypothetical protein